MGIMYDGNRYKKVIVFNQAFLDEAKNKMAYFSSPTPCEAKDLDDFEWKNEWDMHPWEGREYPEVYPNSGLYYHSIRIATRENEFLAGSPDKKIGIHIRKVA